jgi:NAD(P)-dependent dehydrogenase (short-subunit alcohol dehydrogenase family)
MINKTAIITGASGNMGQAVVKKFLAEGYHVLATIIPNDPVPFEIINAKLEKVVVDLMSEEAAGKFIQTVIAKYGSIDAVVLTVGGFAMGTIASTTTADIYKQYRLNFETAYNIARPAFIQMIMQNSGRIFLIGARPGMDAAHAKGMVAYGLGKSLVFTLAELMNDEAKGKNVVTSVVVPSTIDTPQNRKAMPDANFNNWIKPEDIASAIYYHCTDEAAALRDTLIKVYNNA